MKTLSLLLLLVAATSCKFERNRSMPDPSNLGLARHTSSYWFPNIVDIPSLIPEVPDDFVSGSVTNKHIGDGFRTLVWGRESEIGKLNNGAAATSSPIFVITELVPSTDAMEITPAKKEEFIGNHAAAGYKNIKCGTGKAGGWTVEWASMRLADDWDHSASLSKPGRKSRIVVRLIAEEADLPVWERFLKGITKSEPSADDNRPSAGQSQDKQ